jgi:DNA-binding NarL/FixJ family response regulator
MQTSLAASRSTQREINKPAGKQGLDAKGAQDIPAIQSHQCTDIRTLEKSNEIRHPISVNGFQHEQPDVKKPAIVVVHQRVFFRDCFVRCLEISYKSHDIFAFASISAWRESNKKNALTPSVIVFFSDGNDASSISDLQFLESAAADIPVVIMSDIDDVNYVTRALKGGARGYIPTSLSFNVAVEAVRLVEAGGTFIPASSLDREKFGTTSRANDLLTERQLMVVEALCQGMANKQIAYELSMSEHTVKVHLRHIMRKLNARNRTEVAVLTKDFF